MKSQMYRANPFDRTTRRGQNHTPVSFYPHRRWTDTKPLRPGFSTPSSRARLLVAASTRERHRRYHQQRPFSFLATPATKRACQLIVAPVNRPRLKIPTPHAFRRPRFSSPGAAPSPGLLNAPTPSSILSPMPRGVLTRTRSTSSSTVSLVC